MIASLADRGPEERQELLGLAQVLEGGEPIRGSSGFGSPTAGHGGRRRDRIGPRGDSADADAGREDRRGGGRERGPLEPPRATSAPLPRSPPAPLNRLPDLLPRRLRRSIVGPRDVPQALVELVVVHAVTPSQSRQAPREAAPAPGTAGPWRSPAARQVRLRSPVELSPPHRASGTPCGSPPVAPRSPGSGGP